MQIYILKNHKQEGPYDAESINLMLQSGHLNPSDLGWSAGMEAWQPLSKIQSRVQPPAIEPATSAPVFPTSSNTGSSQEMSSKKSNVDPSAQTSEVKISSAAMIVGVLIWLLGCRFWSAGMIDVRDTGEFGGAIPCFVVAGICCAVLRTKLFRFSWQGIHAMWAVAFALLRFKIL